MASKERIFIVEDDQTIVSLLTGHLSDRYQVATVQNFRAVLQEIQEFSPDLVLMDIGLPYFNGFYWTTELRKTSTVPIIFISSADDDMNAVMAMDMGGDDFVAKPFSLAILDAKIGAFLRRFKHFNSEPKLSWQGFQLSLDGTFSKGNDQVHLSQTETKILAILLEGQETVVSKDLLLEKLWEGEAFIDQNTLNVNMTRLRKKLASIGFQAIHTIRNLGYMIQ